MIVVSVKATRRQQSLSMFQTEGTKCKKLTKQAIGVMGSQRDQVTKQSGQEAATLPKPGAIRRGKLRTPGVNVTQ